MFCQTIGPGVMLRIRRQGKQKKELMEVFQVIHSLKFNITYNVRLSSVCFILLTMVNFCFKIDCSQAGRQANSSLWHQNTLSGVKGAYPGLHIMQPRGVQSSSFSLLFMLVTSAAQ